MLPSPFDTLPAQAIKTAIHQKGKKLFLQGDKPFAVFYLEQGLVQLLRHSKNGDEVIIHRARSGETFAEASLFSHEYHCDGIVLEPSTIIKLDKAQILKTMGENADFALALSARFAGQIQSYRRMLEIHAIRSAKERVFTAVSQGMLNTKIKPFAAQIALSHEATYRALAQLVKEGRLEKTGRGAYSIVA